MDFDFFSDQPLEKETLRAVFPFVSQATVLQDQLETFTLLVKDELEAEESYVKLSFFGRLSFGRVGEPELTTDEVMAVASLEDLMAHQLKVILQRIESKDYVDIAALLKAGVSLEKGLSAARALYGTAFQPSESLKALTYFQGGDLELLLSATKEVLITAASQVRTLCFPVA